MPLRAAPPSTTATFGASIWGWNPRRGISLANAAYPTEISTPSKVVAGIRNIRDPRTHGLQRLDGLPQRLAAAGQTEAWYRANIDLDSLYTFAALNRFCGNVDVRGGDNFRFYHRPTDNRWVIIWYDLDMMALPARHWGTNVDGVTYAGVPDQIRAITRHPAIAQEFRNRARELFDLLGTDASTDGGRIVQLIDEYAQNGESRWSHTHVGWSG